MNPGNAVERSHRYKILQTPSAAYEAWTEKICDWKDKVLHLYRNIFRYLVLRHDESAYYYFLRGRP